MDSTPQRGATRGDVDRGVPDRIPGFVDWVMPILLGLVGLALVFGGIALLLLADPDAVADLVSEGVIQSDVFGDEALTDVTVAMTRWSGVGLAITGVLAWVGAVVFAGYRRRNRRQAAEAGVVERRVFTSAFVGAVVTVLASLLPVSPAIGGFVAGYLHGGEARDAGRVGVAASILALVPVAVILLFLFGGIAAGAARAEALGGAFLVASVVVLSLLVTAVVVMLLGWIGGYLAGILTGESRHRGEAETAGGGLGNGAVTGADADVTGSTTESRDVGDDPVAE